MTEKSTKIYISSSLHSDDRKIAEKVYQKLTLSGFNCFLDKQTSSGFNYFLDKQTSSMGDTVKDTSSILQKSAYFLLICTKNTSSSKKVKNELALAVSYHIPCIVLPIDSKKYADTFRLQLADAFWIGDMYDASQKTDISPVFAAINQSLQDFIPDTKGKRTLIISSIVCVTILLLIGAVCFSFGYQDVNDPSLQSVSDLNKQGHKYYNMMDYKNAQKYFSLAANKGDREAMYYLGVLYENGYETERNISEALYWYKKAMDNGYYKANEAYSRLSNSST